MKINVTIFGVSGYTGSQLLSLLTKHKNVNISGVFGEKTIGKKLSELFPYLFNLPDVKISSYKDYNFDDCDLVFMCLPHKKSQVIIKEINNCKIIDLSSDFRIKDRNLYKEWYEQKHESPKYLKNFVYGLSELNRNEIKKAKYIANPGCYPTSCLIPLIPLFKEKIISEKEKIIIDSKSGQSGSGKVASEDTNFSEINEDFRAYNVKKHRHLGEINQEIHKFEKNTNVTFTPHLLPISRGILSTIYISNLNEKYSDIKYCLKKYYENEYFIKIMPDNIYPSLKSVRGTNNLIMGVFEDYHKENIIIVSCIDNLIKGASGQAIQNMNIMFDFNENESLCINNLFP
ncbi:MAG: N-acetyl-gamma-glutamyl-phosphate reductase [Rickettsiales bacterium]|nr:N-acetyl-gamma-glutamyl-phosphate reductase [Rickettsiales bacterium]